MSTQEQPYVMAKSKGNSSGNARYEGFCIDLLREIARMVGFAYKIELVPDGKYGAYDYETGEWNGIVRQLMDKVYNSNSYFYVCATTYISPHLTGTLCNCHHRGHMCSVVLYLRD